MASVTLDCLGLPCPQPVLRTRDALDQGATVVEVLVDNEASRDNVLRFARSQQHQAEAAAESNGVYKVVVTASGRPARQDVDQAAYSRCAAPASPSVVYVIASDSMGRGSDELGWALLQTFIRTIKDVQPLPEKVIFYNSGVKLVTAASGALDALQHLQQRGVEILACGTCLDYYQLKSALQVGHISNMYAIMSAMAQADKVISPM